MGPSIGPGRLIGRLLADAPGSHISARQAVRLGSAILSGATISSDIRTLRAAV
jgi:hypothetical protein